VSETSIDIDTMAAIAVQLVTEITGPIAPVRAREEWDATGLVTGIGIVAAGAIWSLMR
jgi:hypothetical protein